MLISNVVKKPELIQIQLDDSNIVENYGEPVVFWMRDFVDIDTYFEFFQSQGDKDGDARNLGKILKKIILKEDGQPAIAVDQELPLDLVVPVLTKVNENLGKSKTKLSTPVVGAQQN